jgi:hypothetical protein
MAALMALQLGFLLKRLDLLFSFRYPSPELLILFPQNVLLFSLPAGFMLFHACILQLFPFFDKPFELT